MIPYTGTLRGHAKQNSSNQLEEGKLILHQCVSELLITGIKYLRNNEGEKIYLAHISGISAL